MARRRLEAHRKGAPAARWPQLSHNIAHGAVPTFITTLGDLAHQALRGKARIGIKALLQIFNMPIDQPLSGLSRPVNRNADILGQIFSDGLAVDTQLAGDR